MAIEKLLRYNDYEEDGDGNHVFSCRVPVWRGGE
jgi:hypothetical protein